MGIPVAVIAMLVLAVVALVAASPQNRARLILGYTAGVCPFLIALIVAPPLMAFLVVMRSLAPTRLRWAGAASGFAAGAIGALARPATAALVARSPENHPTVTFCFVPTN